MFRAQQRAAIALRRPRAQGTVVSEPEPPAGRLARRTTRKTPTIANSLEKDPLVRHADGSTGSWRGGGLEGSRTGRRMRAQTIEVLTSAISGRSLRRSMTKA
jgi:hypothetical protein